jgi:hypothetical protein
MNPPVYPLVYNLDQAADMLSVTQLLEWLYRHPYDENGTPFYRSMGQAVQGKPTLPASSLLCPRDSLL